MASGFAIAAVLAALLMAYVGWLGLGILGLLGLVVSVRAELFGGPAAATSEDGSGSAAMTARQAEAATEDDSSEGRSRDAAARPQASAILQLVNGACLAMAALGFGLFVLHQF
jgi:hypothetical protein